MSLLYCISKGMIDNRKNKENKMKALSVMIVFCMLATGLAWGEELKMDGWGNFKWGMSEDDVKRAEKKVEAGDGKQVQNYYFPLILKGVKIADVDFVANFRFDNSSKTLNAVSLIPPRDKGNIILFDEVFDLLLTKYGKPVKDETDKSISTRKAFWTIDKTKISLSHAGGEGINLFALVYEVRENKDNL